MTSKKLAAIAALASIFIGLPILAGGVNGVLLVWAILGGVAIVFAAAFAIVWAITALDEDPAGAPKRPPHWLDR